MKRALVATLVTLTPSIFLSRAGVSYAADRSIGKEEADRVASSILDRIRSERSIGPWTVKVIVGRGSGPRWEGPARGVARLEGSVASEMDRERIEAIARDTEGIVMVENALKVAPVLPTQAVPVGHTAPSADLASRVINRIRSASLIGAMNMSARQSGSTVTLEGMVNDDADKYRIEELAKSTEGVGEVVSRIVIVPPKSGAELQDEIMARLASAGLVEAVRGLQVRVTRDSARIEGDADDHAVVDHILAIALNVNGIEHVESGFTIRGEPYAKHAYAAKPHTREHE